VSVTEEEGKYRAQDVERTWDEDGLIKGQKRVA